MPVPVHLLFSSSLLTETGVEFSRGRLTGTAQVGDSATFLKGMNFKDIYRNTSVGRVGESQTRSEILNARHSEVLIKDQLYLDRLKCIVCRSGSERDTLLNLLDSAAAARWSKKVMVDDGRGLLFFKWGTFVKEAHLSERESQFGFHPCPEPQWRGPFHLRVTWTRNSWNHIHEDRNFTVSTEPLKLPVPGVEPLMDYRVQVQLNEDTAFLGQFESKDGFDGLL